MASLYHHFPSITSIDWCGFEDEMKPPYVAIEVEHANNPWLSKKMGRKCNRNISIPDI